MNIYIDETNAQERLKSLFCEFVKKYGKREKYPLYLVLKFKTENLC
jgi:hypothetical protein